MFRAWAREIASLPSRAPSRCEVCRRWPARPVCTDCRLRFAHAVPRCRQCALPVPPGVPACGNCLREPPPLDACHAALPYAFPWDGLITRFKFRAEPGWARVLAGFMREHPGIADALAASAVVLPLPLSPRRLAERGFNQSFELARRLAPGRADAHLLLRTRDTPPQARLARAERLRNVADAFAVEPLRAGELQGRPVLLVDDVMTSGASLHAAARALHRAGAGPVRAAVLARTDEA